MKGLKHSTSLVRLEEAAWRLREPLPEAEKAKGNRATSTMRRPSEVYDGTRKAPSTYTRPYYGDGQMSLGIAFKGPEGVVLAADSRVTIFAQNQRPDGVTVVLPATYDNATKLLSVKGQDFIGAVTYGAGAIGQNEPRTAHSYMPEFEVELAKDKRLSVEDFAKKLSAFFLRQWNAAKMPAAADNMVFLVGGYDENAPYGRVFEIFIPSKSRPTEPLAAGMFGAVWGGQREMVDRLLNGADPRLPALVCDFLKTPAADRNEAALYNHLRTNLAAKIPWQLLPLQDCVDLAIFLVRATITLQRWTVDIRGVGGAIDVATITRVGGFKPIQQKTIVGEKNALL
jgi:hypothetical protein